MIILFFIVIVFCVITIGGVSVSYNTGYRKGRTDQWQEDDLVLDEQNRFILELDNSAHFERQLKGPNEPLRIQR
jgi:hypothetical protein